MSAEITMPQLSDTMSEGTVVKWLKKEGDKVKENEKIAEVETDKAIMEMEAFEAGTLAVIVAKEGDKVAVGAVIAVLAGAKENAADVKKQYSAGKSAAAAPAEKEAEGGTKSAVATLEAENTEELHEPDGVVGHGATREHPTAVPPLPHHGGNGGRMIASPLAKRIAADTGIDLTQIKGSGPGGRIVRRDVEGAAPAAPSNGASVPTERMSRGEKQVVPLTKMRQAIAKALQASKQSIPHFYETIDVDVEELSALRGRLNVQLEAEQVRLSLGDLIAKAVTVALSRHSGINAHYNSQKNEITRFGDVHLGFAVALPEGLIVPVLRNIDQMGLKEIRVRSADLIERARSQRLKQEELSGSTFTISNLGTYGISEFSAIINPPSVGILAVATAEKRPVVRKDQIVIRTMLKLTLSADHRAVDGAAAAEFLRTLKSVLEDPGLMLI
jgi:pyruvate dehydrogenase E2 component (dihydrolipoamide acetyltransferase)